MRIPWIACMMWILLHSVSHGRWATYDDVALDVHHLHRHLSVKKDGTSSERIRIKATIKKESGRYPWFRTIIYNHDSESVRIIKAGTLYQNQDHPVDRKRIEDKPLASQPHGFDQHHQVLVVFPHAEVGATLYLEYERKLEKPAYPGFFHTSYHYGSLYLRASQVDITSEQPLYVNLHDPEQYLQVKGHTSQPTNQLSITLQRPIIKQNVDEMGASLHPRHRPQISVSTLNDWASFARMVTPDYEQVLQQPLPPFLNDIVQAVPKSLTKATDIINHVTSQLAEKMHYMGDWQTNHGRLAPHDLAFIDEKRYGDCKDYATTTTAMLRALGFKAHTAWVKRTNNHYEPISQLPSLHRYNHAIVHVELPQQTLWIDPTNFVSIAPYVYDDIENRSALVLSPHTQTPSWIPVAQPKDSQQVIDINCEKTGTDRMDFNLAVQLLGARASGLTGVHLHASPSSVNHYLISRFSEMSKILTWQVQLPSLTSRVLQDISFKAQYQQRSTEHLASIGRVIPVEYHRSLDAIRTVPEQVGDIMLAGIGRTHYRQTFHIQHVAGASRQLCNIQSPWLDAKRSLRITPAKTVIEDEIEIKTQRIDQQDLSTPAFHKVQLDVEHCFLNGFALVMHNPS